MGRSRRSTAAPVDHLCVNYVGRPTPTMKDMTRLHRPVHYQRPGGRPRAPAG